MKKFYYCGACGHKIPATQKYLTKLYSGGFEPKITLFIGYFCPECKAGTDIHYSDKKSQMELFKKINLYNLPVENYD